MSDESAASLADGPPHYPTRLRAGARCFPSPVKSSIKSRKAAKVAGLFLGATLPEGVEALEKTLRHISPPLEQPLQVSLCKDPAVCLGVRFFGRLQ